jgi:hypothetical protein
MTDKINAELCYSEGLKLALKTNHYKNGRRFNGAQRKTSGPRYASQTLQLSATETINYVIMT